MNWLLKVVLPKQVKIESLMQTDKVHVRIQNIVIDTVLYSVGT